MLPECRLIHVNPSSLALPPLERLPQDEYKGPRLIKTEVFAKVLQLEWRKECYGDTVDENLSSVGQPHLYHDSQGVTYYGHVVYPPNMAMDEKLPVIIIFQTGAGPHDLYFRWKADALARGIHNGVQTGHRSVVFIADLLSDDRGWGWDNDKSYYTRIRTDLLEPKSGVRVALRERIELIVKTVRDLQGVDVENMAALCFCLAGQVLMELARMRLPGIQCAAAFHGVYDGITKTNIETSEGSPLSILLCQGASDPFAEQEDLDFAQKQLACLPNVQWNLLSFEGVIHGFTNPAHAFHPNTRAFAYSESATTASMQAALQMFVSSCFSGHEHSTGPN